MKDYLCSTIQECIKRLKEDPEHIIDRCEMLYHYIDEYIAENGSITVFMINGEIRSIFKLGILFDNTWIRYAGGPNDLIDRTMNLCDIKEVVE